ncbi:MAG TPA: VanZ family protein, partial [Polyangiales bacterium]
MPSHRYATDNPRVRSIARWLTLATVLLILYGSLFPFRFSSLPNADLWALITGLGFARTSRGDVVANLLLYAPLGLCLMLAWPARWTRFKGFVWAVVAGTLLSLFVELLQVHASSRVSSLTDLVLNAAGTAIGALAAILYLAMGSTIRIPGAAAGRPDPVPVGLIALWLAFRLAPFVPTIDWQKYKDALKPLLLEPDLAWFDVLRYMVGWLVVGYAVRQVWRREYAVYALVALAALVLAGRVVVVGKTLTASEVTALVACVPLAALLVVLPDRRRALLLSVMLAVVILITGLKPFALSAQPHNFSWVPFMNSLNDNLEVNYSILLEKCFWYFALIWLLARRGTSVLASALLVATLLALLEFVQIWIPGRSAESTDPLLALVGGVLLAILGAHGPQTARIRTATGSYVS